MLFKNTEELTHYVRVDVNMKFDKFSQFIERAEQKFVKPLLGDELYTELNAAYSTDSLSNDQATLLPYVQSTIALYSAFLSINQMGVKVGDLGIQQQVSQNSQPAPAYKVNSVKEDYIASADTAADNLLEFLESASQLSKDQPEAERRYATWYESDANTAMSGLIVYKTSIANRHIDIQNSRRLFLRLKKRIREIESGTVRRLICDKQYETLVSQITHPSEMTFESMKLIELIEPIISKRALYATLPMLPVSINADGIFLQSSNDSVIQKTQASDAEKARYLDMLKNGEDTGYLADEIRLKEYVASHANSYPLIVSSRCWATKIEDSNDYWRVANNPSNRHFST